MLCTCTSCKTEYVSRTSRGTCPDCMKAIASGKKPKPKIPTTKKQLLDEDEAHRGEEE